MSAISWNNICMLYDLYLQNNPQVSPNLALYFWLKVNLSSFKTITAKKSLWEAEGVLSVPFLRNFRSLFDSRHSDVLVNHACVRNVLRIEGSLRIRHFVNDIARPLAASSGECKGLLVRLWVRAGEILLVVINQLVGLTAITCEFT